MRKFKEHLVFFLKQDFEHIYRLIAGIVFYPSIYPKLPIPVPHTLQTVVQVTQIFNNKRNSRDKEAFWAPASKKYWKL